MDKDSDIYEEYPEWGDTVVHTCNLKKILLEADQNHICLFLHKPFYSSPTLCTAPYASDGGVIINQEDKIDNLLEKMKELLRITGASYVLIKTRHPIFDSKPELFTVDKSYSGFILDISGGVEHVWKNKIAGKTRNQIRRGLKANPEVRHGSFEIIDDFYYTISKCWRDLGTPIHSKEFFVKILSAFKEKASLIVLYLNNEPVSAALVIVTNKTIHHPFASTVKKYNHLSINNVLYWKIIETAIGRGLQNFDMGRSPNNSGSYPYKLSWGARPFPLYYCYLLNKTNRLPNKDSWFVNLASDLWKHLPLRFTNFVGPYLIKQIP